MPGYRELMELALRAATHSPDPSTQNGAVVATSDGQQFADCNRFPTGVSYMDSRWERPTKYRFIEHAERNAIYRAAFAGAKTTGATMVCPWAACSDCARAIVQAGLTTLVRFPIQTDALRDGNSDAAKRWQDECEVGDVIMHEGGVRVIEIGYEVEIPVLRRDGELWQPLRIAA